MLSSANIQNIFDTSKKDNNRRVGDYSHSLVIPSAAAGILATPRKISVIHLTMFYTYFFIP